MQSPFPILSRPPYFSTRILSSSREHPWITNLPVVPEPSPALLLLLATALFLHRRHRR
ncbi:MAG: PEP-CTERM sorting domain-containing protein [Roseibacillus sp.]